MAKPPDDYDLTPRTAAKFLQTVNLGEATYGTGGNPDFDWHAPPPEPKFNGHVKEEAKEPAPLDTIDASSFAGKPRPVRQWLDKRELIPFAHVTNFTGTTAVGKTLLMLQVSIACVTGTPWIGAAVGKARCCSIAPKRRWMRSILASMKSVRPRSSTFPP